LSESFIQLISNIANGECFRVGLIRSYRDHHS
jgi:hypothetical protein